MDTLYRHTLAQLYSSLSLLMTLWLPHSIDTHWHTSSQVGLVTHSKTHIRTTIFKSLYWHPLLTLCRHTSTDTLYRHSTDMKTHGHILVKSLSWHFVDTLCWHTHLLTHSRDTLRHMDIFSSRLSMNNLYWHCIDTLCWHTHRLTHSRGTLRHMDIFSSRLSMNNLYWHFVDTLCWHTHLRTHSRERERLYEKDLVTHSMRKPERH